MSEKEEKVVVAKTPYELQRMKLDKLMKNPVNNILNPVNCPQVTLQS